MGKLCDRLSTRLSALELGEYPTLTLKERDPVKWEILYTRLSGIVQNARETARRVSASPVVREMGECIFAFFTPEGESVCFSTGLLLHVASMGGTIKFMLENEYEERVGISEGDYFMNNDPFIGGAHSPDQTTVTPVVVDGHVIGWAGGLTHVPETGASEPGGNPISALTRYEEGIYMPCVKVAERDDIRHDLEIMVERGTRTAADWLLDQRARIAGCRLIRDGVKALVEEVRR